MIKIEVIFKFLISKVDYFVALLCWRRFCILPPNFTKFLARKGSVARVVVAVAAEAEAEAEAVLDIY